MADRTTVLSYVSIAVGILLYVASVAGAWGDSTPLGDVGAMTLLGVFVLLGLGGLMLARSQASAQ